MAFNIQTDILPGSDSLEYTAGNEMKKWLVNGHIIKLIELEIPLESTNGTSLTVLDDRITPNHVVLETIMINKVSTIG